MHTLAKEQDLYYSVVSHALEQNQLFFLVYIATMLLVRPHVPMPMMLESSAHQVGTLVNLYVSFKYNTTKSIFLHRYYL